MRKPVAMLVTLVFSCCLGGIAAGPRSQPHRYLPHSLDGELRTVVRTTDGASFAAWSYRSGAEYDIAVARAEDSGRWTEPQFFGADDGMDQVDPVLAADAEGNVYLAYTDPSFAGIRVTALRPDGTSWREPIVLRPRAAGSRLTSPGLLVLGNDLVVAYAEGGRTSIVAVPRQAVLGDGSISTLTITESGDPVGYAPGDEGSGANGGVRTIGEDDRPVDIFAPIRKRDSSGSGDLF